MEENNTIHNRSNMGGHSSNRIG